MKKQNNNRLVTVCDKCLKASCYQGIFLCDDAYYAGEKKLSIKELKKLNLEHPSYWENEDTNYQKIFGEEN